MDPKTKGDGRTSSNSRSPAVPARHVKGKKMIRRRQEGEKKQKNDTRGNQNRNYDETTSQEL